MFDIIVVGSFMTDLVVKVDKVPIKGETILGNSFHRFTGGKGANQAIQAARLGAKVAIIGNIGKDDFGNEHIKSLESEKIDYSHVNVIENTPTGIGNVLLESDGNNRIIIIGGANQLLNKKDIIKSEDIIRESKIVVLQLEVPIDVVYQAIDIAFKYKKTIILNPAPAKIIKDEYLKKVDYLIPNESELSIISGKEIKTTEEVEIAIDELLEKGVKNVLVTLGSKGAYFKNKNETIKIPAFKTSVIDTTAAGDSFIGTLAYGLSKNKSIKDAIILATAAGAKTVTKLGAQPSLPSLLDVEEVLK